MKLLRIIFTTTLILNLTAPYAYAQEESTTDVIQEEVIIDEPIDEVDVPQCEPSEPDITIDVEPEPFTEFYPDLKITELLPDPVSPATDKEDEYVELFNPNAFMVDLEGYIIETGSDFRYSYVLPKYDLAPGEYIAIFSVDSKLTLSNSGGMARLLTPDSNEIDITQAYTTAKAGESWSLNNQGVWDWTVPTPHNANVFAQPEEESSETEVLAKRTPINYINNKTPLEQEASTFTQRESYSEPPAPGVNPASNMTLVVMGIVALLYASYEYRNDIVNFYKKFRRHIFTWRQNRKKS